MCTDESIITFWKDTIKVVKQSSSLGICLSHLEILTTVYLNDGITRQDLMDCIENVSPTTLKRYVKDLVKEYSYITETYSEDDTRIKQLHISVKGQRLMELLVEKTKECFSS